MGRLISKYKYIVILLVFLGVLYLSSCNLEIEIIPPPIDEVTITFNTNSSIFYQEYIKGKPGMKIDSLENPLKDNYRFSHWELDGEVYELDVFPNESIVINATWNRIYYIYFEVGDFHEPIEPLGFIKGELISNLPKLNQKIDNENNKAYLFINWEYNNTEFNLEYMIDEDILLDAKWEEKLIISFDTGLSYDIIDPLIIDNDKNIKAPKEIPFLENHVFIGWFYQNKPYIFGEIPNNSINLEAVYLSEDIEYNSISNLPKMFINLENNININNVNRENYLDSQITITSNIKDDNLIAVSSLFKGRGHGSWDSSGPKKGYRLKFFNKESLFGEAKSKHWVLLAGANFYDPTLAKNVLAFSLANNIFKNIEYATSTNWVELYINGQYRGVYILAEHTRVDESRVNVNAEYGVLDTGYLIEYNAYAEEDGSEGLFYFRVNGYKHPFSVKRPDPDDIYEEGISEEIFRSQVEYIKNYVKIPMEAALNKDFNTFSLYADVNSFIDMYLLHELFKNTDTGWSSFFMVKKPNDKLYLTSPWDFDATAGKSRGDSSFTGFYVSDTIQYVSDHTASELFINLMKINEFKELVFERWHQISSDIKNFINDFLSDEFILENKFSFGRNYKRWSNLGPDGLYGTYPTTDYAENKWSNDVIDLRNWLINRSVWFDNNFI